MRARYSLGTLLIVVAVAGVIVGSYVMGTRLRRAERELQVLRLICAGRSNREIAAALDLSVNTVGVHRTHIMDALGVHKTAELVMYALQHGLINPL